MKFQSEAQRIKYEEDYRPAYDALMKCYPFTLDAIADEVWKPINDDYHISNYGRIKSFQRYRAGKILKPALTDKGYLYVNLHMDGKQKHFYVHILVAQAFIPNPEDKPEVNHRIGWKLNCYVGNLEWSTSSENQQHAYDTGLKVAQKGTERWNAKINDEQIIIYIRENPDELNTYQLAEKFGMTEMNISQIQLGKSWGHVGGTIRKAKPRKYTPRVSEETKQQIRADRATGNFTYEALAKKYNLSRSTVWNIVHEKP